MKVLLNINFILDMNNCSLWPIIDLADLSERKFSFTKDIRNSLHKDGVIAGVDVALSLTGISSSDSL